MMGTAFEILLDFPSGMRKSEYFADYINRHLTTVRSLADIRRINNQDRNLSLAACWAVDFYRLRNQVVHGDQVPRENLRFRPNHWLTHLIVADMVFEECLKRILFEHRLLGETAYELARDHGGTPEDWAFLMHFGEYQEAVGWIEPLAAN